MQRSLRILTVTILSATLLAGCGRKKIKIGKAEPAPEAAVESSVPASESTATFDDQPTAATAEPPLPVDDSADSAAPVPVEIPSDSPVAMPPAGVSPELANSDQVYEAWFRKYSLDLNDPNMLDADPDGDGVSNRDEFMADTNPLDPKSRPAAMVQAEESHAGLRLKEYNEVRLPVMLESVEGQTARIKYLDGDEKVETVRAGQTLPGLGLKVEKVQPRRITDKHGSGVDASRITLENPETQEKVTLVKDMPALSASSYAVLTSEDGSTSIKVRQGETFSWPNEGGSTFKVIDLRADQAVLQEEATGKMWTVMK